MSQKKRKEKLRQGTQSVNGLKARVGGKKTEGTAITATTKEKTIKRLLIKGLKHF